MDCTPHSHVVAVLTQQLRDAYSRDFITNIAVAPFPSGEVLVQHYNSCLSLATANAVSDAVIVVQNEDIASICTSLLDIKTPSFGDLNSIIASQLASILLPSGQDGKYRTCRA